MFKNALEGKKNNNNFKIMSLKIQNESDDSLLDISKLSKESKKRKTRRRPKELPAKPLNSTAPIIFKS